MLPLLRCVIIAKPTNNGKPCKANTILGRIGKCPAQVRQVSLNQIQDTNGPLSAKRGEMDRLFVPLAEAGSQRSPSLMNAKELRLNGLGTATRGQAAGHPGSPGHGGDRGRAAFGSALASAQTAARAQPGRGAQALSQEASAGAGGRRRPNGTRLGCQLRSDSLLRHQAPLTGLGRQSGGPLHPVMTPSREQILAASAGWVAVLLNVIPGLGAGYLYQRRWKAYWITSVLATAWFVAGAVLGQNADAAAEVQNQLVGLIGLLALAAVTATEAGLAVKRVRQGG
jgi:hypothetical protein